MKKIEKFYTLFWIMALCLFIFSCKNSQDIVPKLLKPAVSTQLKALREQIDTKYIIDIKGSKNSYDNLMWERLAPSFSIDNTISKDFVFGLPAKDNKLKPKDFPLKAFSTAKLATGSLLITIGKNLNIKLIIRQGNESLPPYKSYIGESIHLLSSHIDHSKDKKYEVLLASFAPLKSGVTASMKVDKDAMHITLTFSVLEIKKPKLKN